MPRLICTCSGCAKEAHCMIYEIASTKNPLNDGLVKRRGSRTTLCLECSKKHARYITKVCSISSLSPSESLDALIRASYSPDEADTLLSVRKSVSRAQNKVREEKEKKDKGSKPAIFGGRKLRIDD